MLLTPVMVLLPLVAAEKKNTGNKSKTPTVAETKKAQAAASKKVTEARKALKAAEQKVIATRTRVSKKHLSESGLNEARIALQRAVVEYKAAKEALQTVIRERTDYLEAKVAAKRASADLRALNSKAKMPADRKRAKRSELSTVVRRPLEIEKEALAGNERLSALGLELNKTTGAEQAARRLLARLIAGDAELKKAISNHGKAKETLADAEEELIKAQKQVAASTRAAAQAKRQQQTKNKQNHSKNSKRKKGKRKGGAEIRK